jgi:hypothetical protein
MIKTEAICISAEAAIPDIIASKTTPGMKIPITAKDSTKAAKKRPQATHSGFCCNHRITPSISNIL